MATGTTSSDQARLIILLSNGSLSKLVRCSDNRSHLCFRELLAEKNRKVDTYRAAANGIDQATDLRVLRDDIDMAMLEARTVMNEVLQDQFAERGIKFEQATWDASESTLGRPKKLISLRRCGSKISTES